MNDQVELKLNSVYTTKAPVSKVIVNNEQIFCSAVSEEISVPVDLRFGKNIIEIQLTNKEPADTVVDKNGNITDDMILIIDDIILSSCNRSVKYMIDEFGSYIVNDNLHKTHGWMSWNGSYVFKVSSPSYMWLRNKDIFKKRR